MISEDLNASRISKAHHPFPPVSELQSDQNFAPNGSRNNVFKSPASRPCRDRRSSDGGVSAASSSGSSSSGKRILPPPISRRGSHGHVPTSPTASVAPTLTSVTTVPTSTFSTPASVNTQASQNVFSPSQTSASTDPSAQSYRARNAASSTSSAVPQRLVHDPLTHQRTRSTPSSGFQREGGFVDYRTTSNPGTERNDENEQRAKGNAPPSGNVSYGNKSEHRERRAQLNCRPIHELLPESEQRSGDSQSRGFESRFEADAISTGSDSQKEDATVSKTNVTPALSQKQPPSPDRNLISQHQILPTESPMPTPELRHSQIEGTYGKYPETRRPDEVHPVVLEMLRMQEANIRLLQEQVMYLMRRQSEESCCCARRGSRRCDRDDDRPRSNHRDVGTNVRTTIHLEDGQPGWAIPNLGETGIKSVDAIKSDKLETEDRRNCSTPEADRRSSTSHSGKSTTNEGISTEPASTQSSRRSSRPSTTPSRASSRSKDSLEESELPRSFPGKPASPSTPERRSESPSASPKTNDSPASRGDFSHLSMPRFGESATMLEELVKDGDIGDNAGPSSSPPRTSKGLEQRGSGASASEPKVTSSNDERKSLLGDLRLEQASSEDNLAKDSPRRSKSRNSDGERNNIGPSAENMSIYLPRINYVTLMLGRETDSTENMESLALKYLKDDELAELAGLSPRSSEKAAVNASDRLEDRIAAAVRKDEHDDYDGDDKENLTKNKNYSFATKKYLMKYGLINERSVSFVVPDDKDDESHPGDSRVPGVDLSRNSDARSTSSSSSSSPSRKSNMVLDLHKIQHLPKLT